MIGRADVLAVAPLPAGVTLRAVRAEQDVSAMTAMADVVFGSTVAEEMTRELLDPRPAGAGRRNGMEWNGMAWNGMEWNGGWRRRIRSPAVTHRIWYGIVRMQPHPNWGTGP